MSTALSSKTDRYAAAKLILSRIAHPVAIIGAAHGGERSCATGTVMYVSHVPPMVAIAEHPGSRTTRLIQASREFSVSLLHDSQQELAVAAGKSGEGPDKFAALKIPVVEQSGFASPGLRYRFEPRSNFHAEGSSPGRRSKPCEARFSSPIR